MRDGGIARNVGRWLPLVAGVVVAALQLNGAAYSVWAMGEAPAPSPAWWAHRAFAQVCFAGVALALGIAASLVLRLRRVTRAPVALLALALLLLAMPRVRAFLLVDGCLDRGGSWDAATFGCEE